MSTLLSLRIHYERDVVLARQRTRQLAELLGFDAQDQTRIATAVSEIARNAFRYAQDGRVEFRVEGQTTPQLFTIRVHDRGPGIPNLDEVLGGRYRSETGMGLGLIGARRLMDRFEIESGSGGTAVTLGKLLPPGTRVIRAERLAEIADGLARERPRDAVEEIQRQNQELLVALDELSKRQEELASLNRELEDTNRGVVALYAELDEKADHLRRADELKTRFLSNMTHEFRTPVNSILGLARLLLERTDGDLTLEQERQVSFIRKAADALSELVNDLLDLAKVEAGKTVVHPATFDPGSLFGALRGMLRPLLLNENVSLVFEDPEGVPPLHTDEGKISQILRNFISNALKFTEFGEVRIGARMLHAENSVAFWVSDTGIGIDPLDQERIFQEFSQVESPIQRRVRGTGLGLPLCKRLAELLGGRIELESTPGVGSRFTAVIPTIFETHTERTWTVERGRIPVLVVEDDPQTQLIYERFLDHGGYQMLGARTLNEARTALAAVRPRAIVLDILLRGEDSWGFLMELGRRPDTSKIPVIVVTTVEDAGKSMALGADAHLTKPVDRQVLLDHLARLATTDDTRRVLVVDDEEISRYLVRQVVARARCIVDEAASGSEAIRMARTERPDIISLDMNMPDMDGFEVLRILRGDPSTRDIPVVIVTARELDDAQRHRLDELDGVLLPKDTLSVETALDAFEDAFRAATGRNAS